MELTFLWSRNETNLKYLTNDARKELFYIKQLSFDDLN